ncbi:MAG: hypothetical protein ABIW84_04665, partial [Ilumatobacteraceae bacterium]
MPKQRPHDHPVPARHAGSFSVAVVGALVVAGTVLAPVAPTAVQAGRVINVTTTEQKIGGSSGCSLQEAILSANHDSSSFTAPANDAVVIHSACTAGSGADIIELMPGTYQMRQIIDDA